jgi:hypothetical protein
MGAAIRPARIGSDRFISIEGSGCAVVTTKWPRQGGDDVFLFLLQGQQKCSTTVVNSQQKGPSDFAGAFLF